MTRNIGPVDRAIRLIAGIGLLSLIFIGPQTWWGLLGLVPLGTALTGWCPPYALFGINTCSARREANR
jgi:hypothetical protein